MKGKGDRNQHRKELKCGILNLYYVSKVSSFSFFFSFCFVFFNFLGFCSSESLIFVKIIIYEFASFSS